MLSENIQIVRARARSKQLAAPSPAPPHSSGRHTIGTAIELTIIKDRSRSHQAGEESVRAAGVLEIRRLHRTAIGRSQNYLRLGCRFMRLIPFTQRLSPPRGLNGTSMSRIVSSMRGFLAACAASLATLPALSPCRTIRGILETESGIYLPLQRAT